VPEVQRDARPHEPQDASLMTIEMNVRHNLAEAGGLLRNLDKLHRRAAISALNRTAQQVKTAANRKIREKYSFKARVVSQSLKVARSQFARLEVSVISEGRRIQVIEASARKTPRGVSVLIGKQRKLIAGAFIARMKSGHLGVFSRRTKKRLPIDEIYTIAIAEAFGSQAVTATMRLKAEEVFIPRFEHEVARLAKAQAPSVVRAVP
jgi:hypothetical protein